MQKVVKYQSVFVESLDFRQTPPFINNSQQSSFNISRSQCCLQDKRTIVSVAPFLSERATLIQAGPTAYGGLGSHQLHPVGLKYRFAFQLLYMRPKIARSYTLGLSNNVVCTLSPYTQKANIQIQKLLY